MKAKNTLILLSRYAPGELAAVRQRNQDGLAYLETDGVPLGPSAGQKAILDASQTVLRSVSSLSNKAMQDTSRRLCAARWIELIGSIVSLLASGGVVGVTAFLQNRYSEFLL